MNQWIGVDLDGTLAQYQGWVGGAIGEPIPAMVDRVKAWLAEGKHVRIFTARVSVPEQRDEQFGRIGVWCLEHLGVILPVTCEKDIHMIELWDDRCVRVRRNQGVPCCGASDL